MPSSSYGSLEPSENPLPNEETALRGDSRNGTGKRQPSSTLYQNRTNPFSRFHKEDQQALAGDSLSGESGKFLHGRQRKLWRMVAAASVAVGAAILGVGLVIMQRKGVLLRSSNRLESSTTSWTPTRQEIIARELSQLRTQLDGDIYFPHQGAHFKTAARVWVQHVVGPPAAVIEVDSERDVQLVVPLLTNLSRDYDVPFTIRSGGHHKMGLSTAPGGVVLSLVRMNQVRLHSRSADLTTAVATMGPSLRSGEFIDRLLREHGYAGVVGFCASVAESGFILGGGFGLQSRLYGLGLDNVLSMRIVLADGQALTVSHQGHADLFWALRGAGNANFGVVTQLDYQVHQSSPWLRALQVVLVEPDDLAVVLQRLGEREADLPRNLLLMQDEYMTLNFLWSGSSDEVAQEGLTYMKDLFDNFLPETTLVNQTLEGTFNWLDITNTYSNSSWGQAVGRARCWTGFLHPINNTEAIWKEIMKHIVHGLHSNEHLQPDIELWGGRIHDVAENETAFPFRSSVYNVGVLLAIPADVPDLARVWERQSAQVESWWPQVAQYLTGSYVNYPSQTLLENRAYLSAFWGDHVPRLIQIKQKYDPQNAFRHPLGIPISPS